jgi:hypothetical protein
VEPTSSTSARIGRLMILFATGLLLTLATIWTIQLWGVISSHPSGPGVDFHQYQGHVQRWLTSGQFYLPRQLAGPTSVMDGDPLYPPIALYLLVPFHWLPDIAWWVPPLAILAYAFVRFRPGMWTWPLLAAVLAYPRTEAMIFYGNPGMWIDAAIASGLLWGWPAVLVLLKPSLGPFALMGIRHRSWWIAIAVIVVASLPFAGLWFDYVTVLRNSSVPLTYSVLDLPLALAPVVAWLGRSDARVGIAPPWEGRIRRAERTPSVTSPLA